MTLACCSSSERASGASFSRPVSVVTSCRPWTVAPAADGALGMAGLGLEDLEAMSGRVVAAAVEAGAALITGSAQLLVLPDQFAGFQLQPLDGVCAASGLVAALGSPDTAEGGEGLGLVTFGRGDFVQDGGDVGLGELPPEVGGQTRMKALLPRHVICRGVAGGQEFGLGLGEGGDDLVFHGGVPWVTLATAKPEGARASQTPTDSSCPAAQLASGRVLGTT